MLAPITLCEIGTMLKTTHTRNLTTVNVFRGCYVVLPLRHEPQTWKRLQCSHLSHCLATGPTEPRLPHSGQTEPSAPPPLTMKHGQPIVVEPKDKQSKKLKKKLFYLEALVYMDKKDTKPEQGFGEGWWKSPKKPSRQLVGGVTVNHQSRHSSPIITKWKDIRN